MKRLTGFSGFARFLSFILVFSLVSASPALAVQPKQTIYARTIEALQQRYTDEVIAEHKYNAYALRAEEENYPNIAHLFRALAASEAVHARNFSKLLSGLGVEAQSPDMEEYFIAATKENIHHATTVEADEIDQEYPSFLFHRSWLMHQLHYEELHLYIILFLHPL